MSTTLLLVLTLFIIFSIMDPLPLPLKQRSLRFGCELEMVIHPQGWATGHVLPLQAIEKRLAIVDAQMIACNDDTLSDTS